MAYETKSFESIYEGSYGPLEPSYGTSFTGYHVPFYRLGAPTSPQTANQIAEVTARLSEGIKNVELQPLSPELFETIPKDHWKEFERMAKLTGANLSIHAPIVDPAGFTREGWNESYREQSERRLKQVVDRAHELDPKGNVPVNIHATGGVPSSEWRVVEGKPEQKILYVVNRDTGQIAPLEIKPKLFPVREELPKPMEEIKEINDRSWASNRTSVIHSKLLADDMIKNGWELVTKDELKAFDEGRLKSEQLTPEKNQGITMIKLGQARYDDLNMALGHMFDEAMRYAPTEKENKEEYEKINKIVEEARQKWQEAQKVAKENPYEMTRRYNEILNRLAKLPAPQMYMSAETFSLEKSKVTIANVALDAYKKYGESAPIISMENVYPGTVFSRAEELANLIKESRKEFVERAQKQGISADRAGQIAKKLIGATWDVGHITQIRKYGYGEEKGVFKPEKFAKVMAEETRKIAPFIKHVHLTDNFGFDDTHLAPGMGIVPFKDIMKELEKAGYKGREIVEAGGVVAQYKVSPTPYVLEALGSPLYAAYMQPFWNQVRGTYGMPAGYSAGYGMMLPEQHFGTYGGGFSALPMELGGQIPGKGQKFAGAPME